MKKIISAVFILTILLSSLAVSAHGMPYWYPDEVQNPFPDFHGVDLPRVVDDADMFTDAEEKVLTDMINKVISKHGYDLVIFTDVSTYGLSRGVYAADFYQFNGYGKGDDYSGSVLFICMESGNRGWWSAARGSSRTYFNEENVNGIDDRIEPYMVDGDYYKAMQVYIDAIDELYTKGKVSHKVTPSELLGCTVVAAVLGLIVGLIVSSKEKAKMNKVKLATYADNYVVNGSFRLNSVRPMFLYKNVTKTYVERGGGGSGGRSSYSGGYSSSGGGSFSGGGRSF